MKNIARDLQGKKYLHGPIAEGDCAACHDPHGSDYFRLLTGAYPAKIYVPFQDGTYAFCFQCHDRSLIENASTTTGTRFRNGGQNLHYLHVADPRKGRTCRTCHEPHAGNNRHLVCSEGASFGAWQIPVHYQETATGGSCAPGCHRPLSYDREKPQANP